MKRAMIKNLNTQEYHYFGELDRSGNPRSEFHTVADSLQSDGDDTKIIVG
jgi:hypothetical protein